MNRSFIKVKVEITNVTAKNVVIKYEPNTLKIIDDMKLFLLKATILILAAAVGCTAGYFGYLWWIN